MLFLSNDFTSFLKFNDGSPNKEDCENGVSSGDRRSAQDYENEEYAIDEEANSGDKKKCTR